MKHWKYRSLVLLLVFTLFVCVAIPAVMAKSSSVTALTIRVDGPVFITPNRFDITGKLTGSPTGVGVSDKLITVSRSTDGKKWATVGTAWTDSGGYYTQKANEDAEGKYIYRASFAGDKIFKGVTSPSVTVQVNRLPTHINLEIGQCTDNVCAITAILIYDENNLGIDGKSILLLGSTDGNTWDKALAPPLATNPDTTRRGGLAIFGAYGGQSVKAVFDGDAWYAPSSSSTYTLP